METVAAGKAVMNYDSYFHHALARLRDERRYRVFADLERIAGRYPRAILWHLTAAGRLANVRFAANSCRSSKVAFLPLADIVKWLPCTGVRGKWTSNFADALNRFALPPGGRSRLFMQLGTPHQAAGDVGCLQ
jgi:hypothetical protein